MFNRYYFTIVSCCLFFCHNAYAVDLKEALKIALSNNANIELERARLDQVKASKGNAISEFLPNIEASYQKGRQKNDALGLDRGDVDKMTDQDYKQVSITQPIFDGFKSYNYSKEIDYNIKAATYYYKAVRNEVLLQGVSAYLNLYKSQELLKLKEQNFDNAQSLLNLVKQRNKFGRVGGSEVLKYETTLSSALSDNLAAKKEVFKAKEEFRKIFGEIDNKVVLPYISEKTTFQEEELQKLAVFNPILRSYFFKIKAAKHALNKRKGEFSPKVELYSSMSEQRNVTYLSNRDLRSEALYLNLKIPIFQKGTEYFGYSQAKENLKFATREYQSNKENTIKDLNQTHREFLFYQDLIKSHSELVQLTKSRIQKIKEQVKVGRGDVIDLYSARLELNNILEEELVHKTDYVLSYYKLLMLIGKFKL